MSSPLRTITRNLKQPSKRRIHAVPIGKSEDAIYFVEENEKIRKMEKDIENMRNVIRPKDE
jgi:hypothetical protein